MVGVPYIACFFDAASHDDDFFHLEKCLGIFCCGTCKIGQGPNGDYGDGVLIILAKQMQDLLMGSSLRRSKHGVRIVQLLLTDTCSMLI